VREGIVSHHSAAALYSLGTIADRHGDLSQAQTLLEEALAIARTAGSTEWFHWTVLYLGHVASRRGDGVAAAAHYRETIQLCCDSGEAKARVL
jgi:uncharacterized protein HemY